ncbi:ras association (RalGDS/AF-6) domain-containing protein [Phthorimaea operculella]|nr:ras association (RalGDS/AF-6) domain-containing protein [Phthorimaea operculella]
MEVRVRAAGLRTTLVLDDDARPAALQACHPKGYSKFSLQMRPGGLVKIYDSALMSSSQYKCLLISERTTADELLAILLHCYDSTEGVERFSLYEVSPSQEYERKLHPDDLPLLVQRAWPPDTDCHFRVRRNPRAPPLPPRTIPTITTINHHADIQEEDEPSRALSALSLESSDSDDGRRYSPVYKFPSISYCRETKNDYLYI